MRPVWGLDDIVLPFVAAVACLPGLDGRGLAIVRTDGELIAGMVFNNWNPDAGVIEVHAASVDGRWVSRSVMREAGKYIFDTCRCQVGVVRTTEDNKPVRRWMQALGADEYIIPRLRGRNEPEVIYTLTEEAFRASRFSR